MPLSNKCGEKSRYRHVAQSFADEHEEGGGHHAGAHKPHGEGDRVANDGNPGEECGERTVFFDFLMLFVQRFLFHFQETFNPGPFAEPTQQVTGHTADGVA